MNTKSDAGKDNSEADLRQSDNGKPRYRCDRCGAPMFEHGCKISCGNCGHRFDCSDLNIYLD